MKIKIYGSGLDAIVACNRLLELGHEVSLYSGGRKIGGHFMGFSDPHATYDLGMVLLERDLRSTKQLPISLHHWEYGPAARPFLSEAFDFILSHMGKIQVRQVKTLVESQKEINDYFISDSLDFLDEVDSKLLKSITLKAKHKYLDKGENYLHPSQKNESINGNLPPLIQHLKGVYGEELFAKFYGKFLDALMRKGSDTVPAKFHRKVWIPLYYPETLEKKIIFGKNELEKLDFYEFSNSSVAESVRNLITKMTHSKRFFLNTQDYIQVDEKQSESSQSIYLLSSEDFTKLAKTPFSMMLHDDISSRIKKCATNEINILHLCSDRKASKTVFLQSPVDSLFRYSITSGAESDQSYISAEFGFLGNRTKSELIKTLSQQLPDLKQRCEGTITTMNFTPRYLDASAEYWNQIVFETLGNMPKGKTLNLIHPDASSFNDNIVRGLSALEKLDW